MATEPNISFIPKKPLAKSTEVEKRPISLFVTLSVVLLVLVAGAYGGVFYYTRTIQNNIAEKEEKLEKFNQEFDKSIIQEARSLENRITATERILDRHVTISPVFELLERATLTSVQFTEFEYKEDEGKLTATLSGVAPGFASLAYQRDVFLDEVEALESFEITEFTLEETGSVGFSAEATITPKTIKYGTTDDTAFPDDQNTSASTTENLSS